MRSSFFGLNVATQGLYTAQTNLDVVNHNISNAETDGYSRQYTEVSATRPLSNAGRGMIGTGAEVTGVSQMRSTYIDNKYWSMSPDLGQYQVKNELLSQVELLFNEPTDSGYNQAMSDLFDSIQTLSTDPSEDANLSNFIDSAEAFTEYFNNIGKQLSDYQKDANFGVKTSVTQINSIASQLATVNKQISNMELNGGTANDLRDERVRLIDKLSNIINVETKETTDVNGKKTFSVSINGQNLVNGSDINSLEFVPRTTLNNPEDQIDLYDIYWSSGKKLYLNDDSASGELVGYLDVRDGNNQQNFKGDIVSGLGTTTIVIGNVSRHDIPSSGTIMLDNYAVEYTSTSYDEGTNQMTFTLSSNAPTGVTNAQIGESVDFKGIPYYINQLNKFVRTMAKSFNEIHKTGNGGTGTELFTYEGYTGTPALDESDDASYDIININNFAFSDDIKNDNDLMLTSATVNAGESANDLLVDMINIRHDTTLFSKGEPDNFMQSIISELAIDANQADSFETSQTNLVNLINNQRQSYSSVDINEESADILRYQQAYNLSAKMISVMDEIYDVTINQLIRT